ncbi:SNRPN upstream reading frame protein isoform X1 [Delphinapterus leucas]|uniref:SNRPN upstream reading frame protein isoform X1 n=2 Tax=Odontoceti TaxID=9722 RepID=A0A2Y9MM64_DELLE|nr:SNRPN upstream reading frame protein isoform X1 [Delphinapterus leucas]
MIGGGGGVTAVFPAFGMRISKAGPGVCGGRCRVTAIVQLREDGCCRSCMGLRRREGDRLHLRRTTEQHVPEVEVQVKRRRTASLSNQECHLYPRRSQQQQQVPVVDFQAELRQAFLAETPRGG